MDEIKKCECGCGNDARPGNQYIKGHSGGAVEHIPMEDRYCIGCNTKFSCKLTSTQKLCTLDCSTKNARKFRTPMTDERRKKISDGISKRYLEGTFNPFWFYKSGWYEFENKDANLFYRSSYEKKAYEILDSCKDVIEVRSESVKIPYTDIEGHPHNYLPDIKVRTVSGQEFLIEVKSNDFLVTDTNKRKFRAALNYVEEHNMQFLIWTEDILFSNNGSTTTSLQAIVRATVATSKILEVMI